MYTFIVPKDKLPYLELLEKWTPTYQTPHRMYLNESRGDKRSQFPCEFPGCKGKQTVFSRPADLDRHYKSIHASNKEEFRCDYHKCPRAHDPFGRKDHHRDHLREFHKEDIGSVKREESLRGDNKHKWHKAQRIWLAERNISYKHWCCAKCLFKNYVAQGWECSSCKIPCEEERVKIRQKLAPGMQQTQTHTHTTEDQDAAPYCGACNDSRYLDHGNAYEPCYFCQTDLYN